MSLFLFHTMDVFYLSFNLFFFLEDEIVVTIDDKDGEGKFHKAA